MSAAMRPGPRNLITDVTGLKVGHASNHRIKTGATVLCGDAPFTAAVHVMGGAPGTRETDLLAPDKFVQEVDGLVLAGGSAFGLDAASGVADAMRREGRGFQAGDQVVPILPAAIIFDLLNGGAKDWDDNPYGPLGAEAYRACDATFALGSVGAGTGATTRHLKGGLGSASSVLASGHTVGALAVVNSHGSTVVGEGPHFWAAPWEFGTEFGGLGLATQTDPSAGAPLKSDGATTICIVATDAVLTQAQTQRMAIAAHDGLARAIVPAHTPFDGDLVFAAATGTQPLDDPLRDTALLGHAAACTLARAIARGIYHAQSTETDAVPCWQDRFGTSG